MLFTIADNIVIGDVPLDFAIFNLFNLCQGQSITARDLTQMILNLPSEAVIVDCGYGIHSKALLSTLSQVHESAGAMNFCQYTIQTAPLNSAGVRYKRKLLVFSKDAQTG